MTDEEMYDEAATATGETSIPEGLLEPSGCAVYALCAPGVYHTVLAHFINILETVMWQALDAGEAATEKELNR